MGQMDKIAMAMVLLVAQAITLDPMLVTTREVDAGVVEDYPSYRHGCPFCEASVCYLLGESNYVDPVPRMVDHVTGYVHWHDATGNESRWLCAGGHVFVERADNGACWCGWRRLW